MRRNRGIFGGLCLFGRNFCVDFFLCNLWAFYRNNHKSEPIRMRECSYSAALSMKSALRCKKNKCSAFSKHRLDKKWRMLLFGRISVFLQQARQFQPCSCQTCLRTTCAREQSLENPSAGSSISARGFIWLISLAKAPKNAVCANPTPIPMRFA